MNNQLHYQMSLSLKYVKKNWDLDIRSFDTISIALDIPLERILYRNISDIIFSHCFCEVLEELTGFRSRP